jgi:hypothetical protein
MTYRSTRQVAGLLGVSVSRLTRAVWEDRITPPEKAPNGAYLWAEEDLRRASWALLGRDIDGFEDGHGGGQLGPQGTKAGLHNE